MTATAIAPAYGPAQADTTYRPVRGASRPLRACLLCQSDALTPYLDLGMHPLPDAFRATPDEPQVYYPLGLMLCEACGQSQLSHLVSPTLLFGDEYAYQGSGTATAERHFAALAARCVADYALPADGLAVDIGSNSGTLVAAFLAAGVRAVGVEPVAPIALRANAAGRTTLTTFWDQAAATWLLAAHGPADLITATNAFPHVHDHEGFLHAVGLLLAPKGVLVIESPWFLRLVERLEWDTIYAEHALYLTLGPLEHWLRRRGWEMIAVQPSAIHGGSVQVAIARQGARPVLPSVRTALGREALAQVTALPTLQTFAQRVAASRREIVQTLWQWQGGRHRVAAVGAPAKGMTLLNACGLGPTDLAFCTDPSPLKQGRVTPGAGLLVRPDSALAEAGITRGLLLAWNFAAEIADHLADWRAAGGQLLLPLPRPHLWGTAA